jgi:type II secretory pathway pseudopilin PulG
MVELIIVLVVMALLTSLAVPSLAQFTKTTKVDQAVHSISTALYHARNEAQRYRRLVAVFVGDDVNKLNPQPQPGILPPKGRVELWTVLTDGGDGIQSSESPLGCAAAGYPDWMPYSSKNRDLTPGTITIPDGVRVLAGNFYHTWNGTGYDNQFWFGSYQKSALGEIKRHNIAYSRNGGMPGWYDGLNSYFTLLVFDEATGEHQLLWCGEWRASSRPRVLPYQLTQLGNPAGVFKQITDRKQIPQLIDAYCLN